MKAKLLLIAFFISLTLLSCSDNPKYITFKKKPNSSYYTSLIKNNFSNNKDYSLTLLNTNLSKKTNFEADNKTIIKDFINNISDDNFVDLSEEEKSELANTEIPYELKLTFSKEEIFIIKIYSDSIISINPWDGIFEEDFINYENIPSKYNLYEFCIDIENSRKNTYTE